MTRVAPMFSWLTAASVKLLVCRPQVDLEAPKKITGIITQGAKDFGSVQFVTAFKVAHSDDGQSWTIVKDETTRTDKVRANTCRVTTRSPHLELLMSLVLMSPSE